MDGQQEFHRGRHARSGGAALDGVRFEVPFNMYRGRSPATRIKTVLYKWNQLTRAIDSSLLVGHESISSAPRSFPLCNS